MSQELAGRTRVEGLKEISNFLNGFFDDPNDARRMYNQALSAAAKATIIPIAKSNADAMDASGALAESIKPRARSKSKALKRGAVASVAITPVRGDMKSIMKYVSYYYPDGHIPKNKKTGLTILNTGIKHGHLQEYGTVYHGAQPWLSIAAKQGFPAFTNVLTGIMKQKVEAEIRRSARKAKKAGLK